LERELLSHDLDTANEKLPIDGLDEVSVGDRLPCRRGWWRRDREQL